MYQTHDSDDDFSRKGVKVNLSSGWALSDPTSCRMIFRAANAHTTNCRFILGCKRVYATNLLSVILKSVHVSAFTT